MPRDSADTRARLLAAARAEFTRHGLDGARVDRIAALAGVNKERIYGHFGSKDRLFEAVIVDVLDEHVAALGLPGDDLPDYVGRVYDYHAEHPDLLRLMQWESLSGTSQPLPRSNSRAAHYDEKVGALARSMGTEASLDTAATLLTLIGLASWPHTLPQLTRLILGPDADGPTTKQGLREHVTAFARRALQGADQPG